MSRIVIQEYTHRYMSEDMYGDCDHETLAEGANLEEALANLRKEFGGRLPNYWGPILRAGKRIRTSEWDEYDEPTYVAAVEREDDPNEEPL